MIASRSMSPRPGAAVNTACPPRRSCVRRRRRPPAAVDKLGAGDARTETLAFGAELPTPAIDIAGVDNTVGFSLIVAG